MDSDSEGMWAPIAGEAAAGFDQLRRQWRDSVASLAMPEPGDVVDERFEVIREIGRGGFGCVFEVRHVHLLRTFALKLLSPQIAQRPGWTERFHEEARATSQLGHPSIIYITDFGNCEKFGSYFAMEYLEGESLEKILESGPLSVEETLGLVRSVASALDAAHDREIVHCDLKPANIFRIGSADRPRWKLLDFGASSIVMSAVETQTLYGTPLYMSPEQAMGESIDRRADVFALGLVAYEASTGQRAWDTRMWLHATPGYRAERPPIAPSSHADLPNGWDAAIMRALAINPSDRPMRAGTLAEMMDAAFAHREPVASAPALSPETVLEMSSTTQFRSSIMPDEFFVISRISEGVTVGELSRLCTGLPFDLEDTLHSMIERGYVVASAGEAPADAQQPHRSRPTGLAFDTTEASSEPFNLNRLMERIDELKERGSFLGALEIMRTALVTWPRHARLHYRYALLLREFGKPRDQVMASLRRAVELSPSDEQFRKALEDFSNG